MNNRILTEYDDILKLEEKLKQLEEYKSNPIVKEYLELFEDIKELKYLKDIYSDKAGNVDFKQFYLRRIHIPENSCNHDIYVYTASYSMIRDPYYYDDKPYTVESEKSNNFKYNEYMCLECGKEIKVEDWENFEKEHTILKNYKYGFKLWRSAHQMYCEKLLSLSSESAKKDVIDSYNDCLVKKSLEKSLNYKK